MEKSQEQLQEREIEDNNAYSLFLYGVRSPVTRDYYLRRLRIFFNHIDLLSGETMDKRCQFFAEYARTNPNLVINDIIRFLQFQRDRVERKEIVGSTLKNFVKPLKLFCEMSDIPIPWKKITRGLPKVKRYADRQKNFIMRKYCGGYCNRCSDIPTKKVSYDIGDGFLVEFYCDNCYQKHKTELNNRLQNINLSM